MSRRKKKTNYGIRIYPAALLRILMAAGLILAVFYSVLLTRKISGLEKKLELQQQIASSLSGAADGYSNALKELIEASESASASLEQETDSLAGSETQPLETARPQPEYLTSLVGITSGTVLDPGQIQADNLAIYFRAQTIDEGGTIYNRIIGKSYRQNDNISLDDLRYLKVLHYNFDHQVQVGELIVNQALVEDFQYIFQKLYEAEYEIQSLHLIDNYWASNGSGEDSDWNSIDANNSSAFCYRSASGSGKLSNHALGRAIDINPQQNPYVSYRNGKASYAHENAAPYIDRSSSAEHIITEHDLCYQLFQERGFTWGGHWDSPKDYQHFEKR